jgi:hypothetical protein
MFRLSIVVGVAVLGISLLLTGSGLSQTETKDPVKTKGKLPQYWKSIALNDSQKEQLFSIQAS